MSGSGVQDCYYDDGDGGISKDAPLIINCCCGRCDADKTCAPDSITGSGSWQLMNSPFCPAEGCGIEGWFVNNGYFFYSSLL